MSQKSGRIWLIYAQFWVDKEENINYAGNIQKLFFGQSVQNFNYLSGGIILESSRKLS